MNTLLPFFNIYKGDIEHIAEIVEAELERAGFSISEIDDMYDDAYDHANEIVKMTGLENLSNVIISEIIYAAEYAVKEKYPDAEINAYADGWASSFEITNIDKLLSDEDEDDD